MKRLRALPVAVLLLATVTSCDFFRALAGRPGSSEIARKRALIERAEATRQARLDSIEHARLDSIAAAERCLADSLYALDTLGGAGLLRNASRLSGIDRRKLDARCYVVVGAFTQESNAARLVSRYESSGFTAEVFRYRSGLCAVFVSPCNTLAEALDAYRGVMRLPFAPKSAWVLLNE